MLDLLCPYCGATEGRCSAKGAGHFMNECKACGRVVEERRSEFVEFFVDRAQDSPLCIVTPDFSENKCYRAPPLDDDPFESIGLITAFSTWSLESVPLFTATSTSFSGQLAELEHKLSESLQSQDEVFNYGLHGASLNMPDLLRAYFQILEVSSVLGLERDSCDHAIQLFRECLSITFLRNRNIEALATAALVQAIREAQEPRTLQEMSLAANIPQKEIGRHIKVLSDSLKLSQPINSNSLAMHMPRFCNLLQLSKTTEDLATHIGEVVLNKSFCTRRNPISISAAAIYLSCQLEDKKRTQTEICKTTGLTEVTLRKVYKELLENLEDLLPADYNPAVPPEKAFPVTAAALGRVCATRAATGNGMSSLSVLTEPSSAIPSLIATLALDSNFGSSRTGSGVLSSQSGGIAGNTGWTTVTLGTPGGLPFSGTLAATAEGRSGMPFAVSNGFGRGDGIVRQETGGRVVALEKSAKGEGERERDCREKQWERMDSVVPVPPFCSKKVPSFGKIIHTPTSSGVSELQPSHFPLPGLDSHLIRDLSPTVWPSHVIYSIPPVGQRLEEEKSPKAAKRGREEWTASPLKGHSQDMSILPGVGGSGALVIGLHPPTLPKVSQMMSSESVENVRRERNLQQDVCEGDRNEKRDREHKGDESSDTLGRLQHSPLCFSTAHVASASGLGRPPAFAGFSPGIWPCVNPASNSTYFEMIPRRLKANPGHPQDTDPYTGESEVANW